MNEHISRSQLPSNDNFNVTFCYTRFKDSDVIFIACVWILENCIAIITNFPAQFYVFIKVSCGNLIGIFWGSCRILSEFCTFSSQKADFYKWVFETLHMFSENLFWLWLLRNKYNCSLKGFQDKNFKSTASKIISYTGWSREENACVLFAWPPCIEKSIKKFMKYFGILKN